MAAIPNSVPNEDKEKNEKLKALSDALGLNHFQAEIDSLKDNMGFVRKVTEESALRLNDVISAVNNLTVLAQGTTTPNPTAGSSSTNQMFTKSSNITGLLADPAAAQGLVTILEGLGKAWTAFRGPQVSADVNFAAMGAEFMQLLMKTSFDKLLMSTYDVSIPPPKRLIERVSAQNVGAVQHELQ